MDDPRKEPSSEQLKQLGERLEKAQGKVTKRTTPRERQPNAMGLAFRITTDLVAALVVGVAIGWALDQWLDTKPLFLLIFFLLGAGAGVLNVYRATKPKP